MKTYISGYCVHSLDRWSLRDSSYQEIFLDDSSTIYQKNFVTVDSARQHVKEKIVSHVINENWLEQYDISKVEPKITRHPKTGQLLNSVKVISIDSIYDSSLTEDDFFMIDHEPRKEKIPGISSLKLYLKDYLVNRANYILNESPFKKIVCTEDSDGRGNTIEYFYITEDMDSTGIVFSKEDFNV